MARAEDVLAVARGEIGYCRWDDPEPGTKYGRWYARDHGAYFGTSGVAFCAMFVSWVLDRAGVPCPGFPGAYCPWIVDAVRGRSHPSREARPGDVVLFDWGRDGVSDHVGIVERNEGGHLVTIEGNTTIGGRTGCVGRRSRQHAHVVACATPDYDGASGDAGGTSIDVDGDLGPRTARAMQLVFCGRDFGDRVISSQPLAVRPLWPSDSGGIEWRSPAEGSLTVAAMQRAVGVDDDGVAGPDTTGALQRHLMANGYDVGPSGDDGYIGHDSCRALQSYLNDRL